MLKKMKTFINKLQAGDNTAQLIAFVIGALVLTAVLIVMHANGWIWFNKFE